jgi:hypothetical protein
MGAELSCLGDDFCGGSQFLLHGSTGRMPTKLARWQANLIFEYTVNSITCELYTIASSLSLLIPVAYQLQCWI